MKYRKNSSSSSSSSHSQRKERVRGGGPSTSGKGQGPGRGKGKGSGKGHAGAASGGGGRAGREGAPSSGVQRPRISAHIYGQHAVQEAWRNPEREIHTLYVTDKGAEAFDLTAPDGVFRPQPVRVDKRDLDAAFPPGAVHQGVAIAVGPLEEVSVEDVMIACADQRDVTLVMLDQVTDPHNVGAIIRTCAAFGGGGVIMQRRHAPELTGVLAKTACGGVEHVRVAYETNLARTVEALKAGGYCVYGLDERGERSIGQAAPGGKCVIVLGAEGSGLRRLVAQGCDELVKLPTQPPIASLNVSNAAAVALYALCGQG